MRSETIVAYVVLGLGALGMNGCSSPTVEPPPPAFDPGPGLGQAKAEIFYPAGPYGVGKGSIIPNFDFIGYANAVAKNDTMQAISLGDFYNPHAHDPTYQPKSPAEDDRLFPVGSQYGAGLPKPTVLAIDVASVWCGPCNNESRCVMPAIHDMYAPCGGGFFLQLQDSDTPGTPATPKNLFTWTVKNYKEDFPSAIDPQGRLGALFAADAFPANFIVNLINMKIIEHLAGVPDAAYWKLYESFLTDPTCAAAHQCASDSDCPASRTCTKACPPDSSGNVSPYCVVNGCQVANCGQ